MRARVRACVRAGGKEGDVPEETTYMITITYDCQEGYKQWTGIAPMCEGQSACVRACVGACVRKEGKEGDVPEETTYMTTITYDCQEGYKQWTGILPMCEEMLCNKPMPVLGATVSHPSLSVHANATYRCSPGHRAAGGDFSHVCQGDGTSSGQRPICEEILCEKIRVPDNSKLLFLSAGLTPGSRTTYKCVPGYIIVTISNETRCTPKGQWDSPLPNSTIMLCSDPPGELVKVCSSELQWTGDDPFYVESTGDWDYVIKEDEPKTPKEKMMAKIGYKASDDKVDHMATGIVASVLLVISVALDGPLLIAHLKMRRRKVSYGMRRFQYRTTVFLESHHAAVDRDR